MQSLACLGVLVAVLAGFWRWDLPSSTAAVSQARIDRAIAQGITHLAPAAPLTDAPSWIHRAAGRLESVNRSLTSSLKDLARKSILGRVS